MSTERTVQATLITDWPNSKQAWERAKSSLSGGVSTGLRSQSKPHPIYFSGGNGATLTDIDGHRYTDFVLGWGPSILGHGNPALSEAVKRQIDLGATYGSGHRLEYEVAETILAAYPKMDQLLWSNTGTEADLAALRIARAATKRTGYVKFEGNYHGWSDPMLTGYRTAAGEPRRPESLGQPEDTIELAHLVPWGDLDGARTVLQRNSDIAAVILEPVLCNSGVIEPPEGFLSGLRELCDEHGVVLIFDEVITGFRIAYGGAVERYGVDPDIVVLAKGIAGGLPLSAIVGRKEYIDTTQHGVVHAGTYNGNPLSLAAAKATLNELQRPGTFARLEALGRRLAAGFRQALQDRDIVAAVNQVGPIVQCGLGVSSLTTFAEFMSLDQTRYDRLLVALLRRGVFALPGGRWYLSTAHTEELIDDCIAQFADALSDICDESIRK